MYTTIGITQFVFLALGVMALNVIIKITDKPTDFARFLSSHGWWLVAMPVLWVAFDQVCLHVRKGPLTTAVSRPLGVLLAAAILGIYGYAIFFPSGWN